MANAPVVQTLDQIMADLAPGAQGQLNNINQRRDLIATNATAQKAGLEAAKVKGFNTINNQMTGRGISFGGIGADEQAQYLAEKYLPAVAGVDMSVNEQNLGLSNEAAKIQSDMRNRGIDIRESQKRDLNAWQLNQEQMAAQAEQARLQREQELRLTQMKINSEQSISAANRAAQYGGSNAGQNIEIRKQAGGGWDVYVDGKKGVMDLATAAKATGGSVFSYLSNGSASDRKAYAAYKKTGDADALRNTTGAFYLGGAF